MFVFSVCPELLKVSVVIQANKTRGVVWSKIAFSFYTLLF